MTTQSLTSKRLEFDDDGQAIEYYFDQGWTDGLPVVPPTAQRVEEFLEHAGRPASEIVCTEPTKGRVITAEKVAINAVMAGCLPQFFPVVLAVVEAMSEPKFSLHAVSVSTAGTGVLTIVNGPIAKQLGLNSGVNLFGPGNRGNATIGRAVRLVLMNATGAVPGVLDKSTLGHAGKYTWCIAEAEDISPWEPLHVERGFSAEQSAVSIFAGLSPIQASGGSSFHPEPPLDGAANALLATGMDQMELVVVLAPELVGFFKAEGWSKAQVKQRLFEVSQRTVNGDVRSAGKGPDSFTVVVAGGSAGATLDIIPLWGAGSNSQSVTKEIRVPS